MARPDTIPDDVVVRGASWFPIYELLDSNGDALNLSSGTVDVTLRLRPKSAGGTPTEYSKSGGNTSYFTDGTDGKIRFLLSAANTAALLLGKYDLEIVYEDTATTPDTASLRGRGILNVEDPTTGTL